MQSKFQDRNIFEDLASAFNVNTNGEPLLTEPNEPTVEPDFIELTNDNPQPHRSRGRKRDAQKDLRMRGKSYEGFAKKRGDEKFKKADRVERQMGPPCRSPFCAKSDSRECNLITEDQRQTVFTLFWETMNWQQRKVHVSSLIDVGPKKRKTTNDKESRRSNTFSYHLVINGERKSVCREMFCHTLSLGTWSVQHWATTGAARENTHPHLPEPKPVPRATAEKRNTVKTFLQSLPKLPSRYCRRTTNKLYLEPDVKSITNLYSMLKPTATSVVVSHLAGRCCYKNFVLKT